MQIESTTQSTYHEPSAVHLHMETEKDALNTAFQAATPSPNPFTPCNRYGGAHDKQKHFRFNLLKQPEFSRIGATLAHKGADISFDNLEESFANTPIEMASKCDVLFFKDEISKKVKT